MLCYKECRDTNKTGPLHKDAQAGYCPSPEATTHYPPELYNVSTPQKKHMKVYYCSVFKIGDCYVSLFSSSINKFIIKQIYYAHG